MAYERKIPVLNCSHEYLRVILYGRWKIPLVYYIAKGICRPGELQREIPQASRRVLDVQLAQLVKHEIICKKVFEDPVPKVEYYLTDLGSSLFPVMMNMVSWAKDNHERLERVMDA
jgi:DNA-binding HxlR family transcriptional regulator